LGCARPWIEGRRVNGFGSAIDLLAQFFHLVTGPAGYGIAIWVLAIIFVWSGLAKLRRPALAAMAMNDFGILRRIRPGLGSALGAVELLLALSLITGTLLVVVLPFTAGLLWFFVLLIARSLWLGKDFSCFCFGDADSRLSRWTLVRTTALALLASALVVVPLRYASFDQIYLLQAISAAALVGTIVLASRIGRLLRWNRVPYGLGNTEVNR
jgi:Methylamine utilisation protein MauE